MYGDAPMPSDNTPCPAMSPIRIVLIRYALSVTHPVDPERLSVTNPVNPVCPVCYISRRSAFPFFTLSPSLCRSQVTADPLQTILSRAHPDLVEICPKESNTIFPPSHVRIVRCHMRDPKLATWISLGSHLDLAWISNARCMLDALPWSCRRIGARR